MTTLEDLAKRLYGAHRDFTVKWAEPLGLDIATWDQLDERGQEAWLVVAREAVTVGAEIQREIAEQDAATNREAMRKMVAESFERMQDRRLLNDPDLRASLDQMLRGEGRVIADPNDLADLPDEAPKLREIAERPRRFARDCE